MSNLTNAIVMYVRCDASEYKKEIKECKKGTEDWQNAVAKKKTAEQFLSIATAVTVVVKVMKDLYKALSACVESANTFNKSFTKLQGVINNSGFSASAKDMDDFAVALSQASQYTRSEINDVQTLFIATNQLSEDGVKRATQATIDLATAMGKDLTTASRSLMKALEEPQTAMEGLRRSGIVFTEQEVEAIKNLEKYGRIAEAQEKILAKVESKFQGISKAISDTPTGTLDKIKNTWENIKTNLGNSILDSIKPSLDALLDALTKIKKWSDEASTTKANNTASSLGTILYSNELFGGWEDEVIKRQDAYKQLFSTAQRYGSEYVKTRIAELKAMDELTQDQERQLLGWEYILEPVMQYEESVKSIKAEMEDITGESEKIPTLWEEWKKSWDENEEKISSVEKELERLRESDNLSEIESNYYSKLTKDLEGYKDKRLQLAGQEKQIVEDEKEEELSIEEQRLQEIAKIEAKIAEYKDKRFNAYGTGDRNLGHFYDNLIQDLEDELEYWNPTNGFISEVTDEYTLLVGKYTKAMSDAESHLADAVAKNEDEKAMYYAQKYFEAEDALNKLKSYGSSSTTIGDKDNTEPTEEEKVQNALNITDQLLRQYTRLEERAQEIRDAMMDVDADSVEYTLLRTELTNTESQMDALTGAIDGQAETINKLEFTWKNFGMSMKDICNIAFNSVYNDLQTLGEALGQGELSMKHFGRIGLDVVASLLDALGQKALVKAGESIAEFLSTKDASHLAAAGKWGAVAVAGATGSGLVRGLARFEHGGIVGGSGITGDKHLIRANAGELILSRIQQERLAHALGGGNSNVISVNFNGQTFGDQDTIATYVYDGIERAKRKGLI